MTVRFVLRVKATNMRCELRVNDVPVGILAPGEADAGAEFPVNEFLVDGSNQLAAVLLAHPRPSTARQRWDVQPGVLVGGPASFEATLVREDDAETNPAFDPVKLDWKGTASGVPVAMEKNFMPRWKAPVWSWLQADVLGADALPAVLGVLQQIQAKLAQRDVAAIEQLMEPKLQEITTGAYGVDPGPLRAAFRLGLNRCLTEPGWRLLPMAPQDMDLRLVANNRMVECLRPDGRHAILFAKDSGASFFLPAMLGRLKGRWQVLR